MLRRQSDFILTKYSLLQSDQTLFHQHEPHWLVHFWLLKQRKKGHCPWGRLTAITGLEQMKRIPCLKVHISEHVGLNSEVTRSSRDFCFFGLAESPFNYSSLHDRNISSLAHQHERQTNLQQGFQARWVCFAPGKPWFVFRTSRVQYLSPTG